MTPTAPPMTEFTQNYLGNLQEQLALKQNLEQEENIAKILDVFLNPQDCSKARIYAKSELGTSVGIIKDRHWDLRDGDIFAAISGKYIRIHLKPVEVMVLRLASEADLDSTASSRQSLEWFRLGHHLGNLHYSVKLEECSILVQFSGDRDRLLAPLSQFDLPSLIIDFEQRSFAPLQSDATHSHMYTHTPSSD